MNFNTQDSNQEKLSNAKERRRRYEAARSKTPEYKERAKIYSARYHSKPENKETVRKNMSKPEVITIRNARRRERRATDLLHALSCRLRNGTYRAFSTNGFRKGTKTAKLIGCSWDFLQSHIESQFTKGMNWDNRTEWHIDHIVPLASAATEADAVALCHFSNLRPMWARDNKIKGDNVVTCQPELLLAMQ